MQKFIYLIIIYIAWHFPTVYMIKFCRNRNIFQIYENLKYSKRVKHILELLPWIAIIIVETAITFAILFALGTYWDKYFIDFAFPIALMALIVVLIFLIQIAFQLLAMLYDKIKKNRLT